jgi:hypothetical protein
VAERTVWRRAKNLMEQLGAAALGLTLYAVRRRQRANKRPHLVLHFDINKTILVSDAVQQQGVRTTLNLMLSGASHKETLNFVRAPI